MIDGLLCPAALILHTDFEVPPCCSRYGGFILLKASVTNFRKLWNPFTAAVLRGNPRSIQFTPWSAASRLSQPWA